MGLAFDEDISTKVESLLEERGVKVLTSSSVTEITGNGKAEGVMLEGGETINADAVILSMGYKPNSALAEKAGFAVSPKGFIKVDDYMRTEDTDVFAVGDCA